MNQDTTVIIADEEDEYRISFIVEKRVKCTLNEAVDWTNSHTLWDALDQEVAISGPGIFNSKKEKLAGDLYEYRFVVTPRKN